MSWSVTKLKNSTELRRPDKISIRGRPQNGKFGSQCPAIKLVCPISRCKLHTALSKRPQDSTLLSQPLCPPCTVRASPNSLPGETQHFLDHLGSRLFAMQRALWKTVWQPSQAPKVSIFILDTECTHSLDRVLSYPVTSALPTTSAATQSQLSNSFPPQFHSFKFTLSQNML